jgi:hypothetical protein
MLTLYPYELHPGLWVFDDPRTHLREEAFVLGMSEMITALVTERQIPDASRGVSLTFSPEPFDHDVELTWQRTADGSPVDSDSARSAGNWYAGEVAGQDSEMEGWLCPALFHYFETTPMKIYVRVDPLPDGIDPIWQVEEGAIDRTVVRGSDFETHGLPT